MMTLFNLKQISDHRSSIMGVGIIWVVLYHFQLKGLIAPVTSYGFMGVDLFIFVSGFGLFYSMTKNNNLLQFYRKRLVRIFPIYLVLGLVYELLQGDFDILNYLWKYSTLGYWTNNIYGFGWFIPSIIGIYFLYPFLHRTVFYREYEKSMPPILLSVILFFIVWCIIDQTQIDRNHFLLLYRLPVFLLGVITAYWINSEKDRSRLFIIISLLLVPFFLLRFLSPSNRLLSDFSTIFLIPLLMVMLCVVINSIKPLRIFKYVGDASLEIFCLHYIVADVVRSISFDTGYYTLVMLMACLVTVLLGMAIHYVWNKLLKTAK